MNNYDGDNDGRHVFQGCLHGAVVISMEEISKIGRVMEVGKMQFLFRKYANTEDFSEQILILLIRMFIRHFLATN